MKKLCYCSLLVFLFALCLPFAQAQNALDVHVGLGTFHNSASGGGLDNGSSLNAFGTCAPGSGDTLCQATGKLGGVFLGIGADIMFSKHFGAGFQANIQPARDNYGPLELRQTFYNVDGIYAPIDRKRFVLQLLGGVGGARSSFSVNQSSCIGTAVCSSQNVPVGSSNHFLVHTGVGVQVFLTSHVFVRPQFDYYFVPNFTDQFGSNSVPGASVSVGYSFGER
ncbi:MAG TPA: outer membrane beta-barrel protein [Bryobacteraceae bacterium]|nr:outer membrane beta-barrel protein [Bryobacteraceae bacterium]